MKLSTNHILNLAFIIGSCLLIAANHLIQQPGQPFSTTEFAPVMLSLGQYLTALRAHESPSPTLISRDQIKLIYDIARERGKNADTIAQSIFGLDVPSLPRSSVTSFILELKSKERTLGKAAGQELP